MILYLHGFRSSPDSTKARQMKQALVARGLGDAWVCPQLPASPAQALALARDLAERHLTAAGAGGSVTLVGSSLGGFYATWLAETLGCRAVLLNPVVHAARDLATQVGRHRSWQGDTEFDFLPEHVHELARAEQAIVTLTRPERYFLLAATGDEVLDWREMVARFEASPKRIISGSDHGLSDFARWLPQVLDFCLRPPGQP